MSDKPKLPPGVVASKNQSQKLKDFLSDEVGDPTTGGPEMFDGIIALPKDHDVPGKTKLTIIKARKKT
jgi:hypothetical protein